MIDIATVGWLTMDDIVLLDHFEDFCGIRHAVLLAQGKGRIRC